MKSPAPAKAPHLYNSVGATAHSDISEGLEGLCNPPRDMYSPETGPFAILRGYKRSIGALDLNARP